MYIEENCFEFDGVRYERLYGCEYRFRVIFSDDDYDYVDNPEFEKILLTRCR